MRASEQSKAVGNILPHLSETELDMYKRGRNAKNRVPKSSSVADYRRATGMECLFGYLYLTENNDRIKELFGIAFNINSTNNFNNINKTDNINKTNNIDNVDIN